jgi:hypothetical protein
MTLSVRDSVFETNSSSSHALSLGNGDILEKNFSPDCVRNGEIVIDGNTHHYFGENRFRYYKPETILAYLFARQIGGCPDIDHKKMTEPYDAMPIMREQFPAIDQLIAIVEDQTGCKVKVMVDAGKFPWFDYDNEASVDFDMTDRESVRQLLFNEASYLETRSRDEDEDYLPEYTDTDMGEELTLYPGEGRQLGLRL